MRSVSRRPRARTLLSSTPAGVRAPEAPGQFHMYCLVPAPGRRMSTLAESPEGGALIDLLNKYLFRSGVCGTGAVEERSEATRHAAWCPFHSAGRLPHICLYFSFITIKITEGEREREMLTRFNKPE